MTRTERKVLDLYAGLGGWSQAFRGHPNWQVTAVDFSEVFERKLWLDDWGFRTLTVESHIQQDIQADIRTLSWEDIGTDYDVILAGPDCRGFTMMNVGDNWIDGEIPDSEAARSSLELLFKTFELIETIAPDYYVIENPTGMAGDYLRAFAEQVDIVHQCQYGKKWQKPTYLAHNIPRFDTRRCSRGADCHVSASRSADAGTQAANIASADRACIPRGLSEAVRNSIEDAYAGHTEQQTLVAVADGGNNHSGDTATDHSEGL
ncbi:DNA cytosine methyltransferase [Haloarcula laminariae]|uniref:DNA cytosine methyltransferase n=1 Tax=Haloarcula laminariae TaxID=2961577 RepID=UPI0021C923DC|nr:DNA cytosine methyltransferase [Halomicroarcula laminariae]